MEDENKIQENQDGEMHLTEEQFEEQDTDKKQEEKEVLRKGKGIFYLEMVLFLVLGVLLGVAFKMEAGKRITIGFNDYRMKIAKQEFDIDQLQKDRLVKAGKVNQQNGQQQEDGENNDETANNQGADDSQENQDGSQDAQEENRNLEDPGNSDREGENNAVISPGETGDEGNNQ